MTTETPTIQRHTQVDKDRFIEAWIAGRIYSDKHLPKVSDGLVAFLPLSFGCLDIFPKEEQQKIGLFYEYIDEAVGKTDEGIYVFRTVRFMHVEDWQEVSKTIEHRQQTANGVGYVTKDN